MKLTNIEREKIRTLLQGQLISRNAIAKQLGVRDTTVEKRFKMLGIQPLVRVHSDGERVVTFYLRQDLELLINDKKQAEDK